MSRLKGRVRSLEKSTLRGAPRPLGWLPFKVQVVDETTPYEPENRRAPVGMVLFRAMKAAVSHWEPPKRAKRAEHSVQDWSHDDAADEPRTYDFGTSAYETLYARAKLKIPANERHAIEVELNRRIAVRRGRAPANDADRARAAESVAHRGVSWDEATII